MLWRNFPQDGIEVIGGGDANESGLEGIADSTNGALSYSLRDDVKVHTNDNGRNGG